MEADEAETLERMKAWGWGQVLNRELAMCTWTGALRISIGAPMVSTIAEGMERGASFDAGIRAITRQLERVHRKMELILRNSDVPPTEAELRTRS